MKRPHANDIIEFCFARFQSEIHGKEFDFNVEKICTHQNLEKYGIAFVNGFNIDFASLSVPESSILIAPRGARPINSSAGLILLVDNPRLAFATVVAKYFSEPTAAGIHPTAQVDPSSTIHPTASVGAFTVIGPDCVVGEGTVLHQHVVLSRNVKIGRHCVIWSHAVLGEDGFGVELDENGNLFRLPHFGGVVLGDHVHIGNFTAVVGGTILPTTIGNHTMVDNLVHIAHNVQIGRNCQVIACAEISGSVKIGDKAWIAPNASILQKLEIGEGAVVGLGAAVTRSVDAHTVVAGVPAEFVKLTKGGE